MSVEGAGSGRVRGLGRPVRGGEGLTWDGSPRGPTAGQGGKPGGRPVAVPVGDHHPPTGTPTCSGPRPSAGGRPPPEGWALPRSVQVRNMVDASDFPTGPA